MRIECDFSQFRDAVEWAGRSLDGKSISLSSLGIRFTIKNDSRNVMIVSAAGMDSSSSSTIPVVFEGDEESKIAENSVDAEEDSSEDETIVEKELSAVEETVEYDDNSVDMVLKAPLVRSIVKVVKAGKNKVVLTSDSSENPTKIVTIAIGKTEWSDSVLQLKLYPELPEFPQLLGTVDRDAFHKAAQRVETAAAQEGMPALSAINTIVDPTTKTITLVSTDGYRLGVAVLEYSPEEGEENVVEMLIPAKNLSRDLKHFRGEQVVIAGNDNSYGLKNDQQNCTSRLLSGKFPAWRNAIPDVSKATIRAILPAAEAVDCLKNVSLMATDDSHRVQLTLHEDVLSFTAGDSVRAAAKDSIGVEYKGEQYVALHNAEWLRSALASFGNNSVLMSSVEQNKPVLLSTLVDKDEKANDLAEEEDGLEVEASEDEDTTPTPSFRYVVMPVRK